MLELDSIDGLIYLIQNMEYALLLLYILTKIQLQPFQIKTFLRSSNVFCFFVVVLTTFRILRGTFTILQYDESYILLFNSIGFAAYFTIFSVLARCW